MHLYQICHVKCVSRRYSSCQMKWRRARDYLKTLNDCIQNSLSRATQNYRSPYTVWQCLPRIVYHIREIIQLCLGSVKTCGNHTASKHVSSFNFALRPTIIAQQQRSITKTQFSKKEIKGSNQGFSLKNLIFLKIFETVYSKGSQPQKHWHLPY